MSSETFEKTKMSDNSQDEFEGFLEGRAELNCKRYLMQLAQNGFCNDSMISDVEVNFLGKIMMNNNWQM